MSKTKGYILKELKTIEKECVEKGISASECLPAGRQGYNGMLRNIAENMGMVVCKNPR